MVLVARSPQGTDEMKKFLGYEWSAAKGQEGIKYLRGSIERIETPLFDPQDRENPQKISTLIRQNFMGQAVDVPPVLQPYATVAHLVDLLDFSRESFDKQISLAPKKAVLRAQSKWEILRLSELVEIISGGTPDTTNEMYWGGDIPWLTVNDFGSVIRFVHSAEKSITQEGLQNSNTKILQPSDLIISARGTVGALAQLAKPMAFNQSCYGLRSKGRISNHYLFYVLGYEIHQLKTKATGSKFDAITIRTFDEVKIPVPPPDVQAQIVAECQTIDEEVAQAEGEITTAKNEIRNAVIGWFARFDKVRISTVLSLEYGKGLPKDKRVQGDYPVMGSNGIDGYHNKYLIKGPAVIVGRKGSAGAVTYVKENCYPIDTTFYVMPKIQKLVNMKYLYYVLDHLELANHIKGIGVPGVNRKDIYELEIPSLEKEKQDNLISEIDQWEQKIDAARTVIASTSARRQAVLQKYL